MVKNFKTSVVLIVAGVALFFIGYFVSSAECSVEKNGLFCGFFGIPLMILGIGLFLGGFVHWFVVPLLNKIRHGLGSGAKAAQDAYVNLHKNDGVKK